MSDLPRRLDPVAALPGDAAAHDEVLDLASRVRVRVVAALEALAAVKRVAPEALDDALRDLDDEIKDVFAEVAGAFGDLASWFADAEAARVRAEAEAEENERLVDKTVDAVEETVEIALAQAKRAHALVCEGISPAWPNNYEIDVERAARDAVDAVEAIRRSVSS